MATERLGSTLPPERLDAVARQIPVGRIGTPAEIGAAVVFLASDGAGSSTALSSTSTAAAWSTPEPRPRRPNP
jgi:NAD(P)-dependent dehydrogenase (short-subunit alcohol dehydrogenase family)